MSKSKDVAEQSGGEVALPSNWQEELAKSAADSAASVRPTSSRISLKSGIVTYQDIAAPDNKLDIVVIGFAHEHTFYAEKYDSDNPSNPECYALAMGSDALTDIQPHSDVPNPEHSNCAECPRMRWGSSLNGGRGKACQQRYRLVAIPASALNSVDEVLSAEVATVKLPVTSGKVWAQYLQTVAALHKRPEWSVVTTLSAKPDAKTQFKAVFTCDKLIDFESNPELYQALLQKQGLAQAVLLKGYDMSGEAAPAEPKKDAKHAG